MIGSPTATRAAADAIRWFLRRREPAFTLDEERAFQRWLDAHPSHRREYTATETLWVRLDPGAATGLAHLDEVLARARQARHSSARALSPFPHVRIPLLAAALAAAVVLAVGATWWWNAFHVAVTSFQTAKGEQRTVVLADGTTIALNTDTAGTARMGRGGRRIVLDRGEAYFNVAHDPDRPFEVLVDGSRIQDIGTEFVVRRETDRVSVAVASGAVRIDLPANGTGGEPRSKVLQRAERVSFTPEGSWAAVEPVDPDTIASWRTGVVLFDSITLAQAIQELNRYRSDRITLDPALGDTRVKGIFTLTNLDEFFLALPTIVPVEITRRPGQIIISRK